MTVDEALKSALIEARAKVIWDTPVQEIKAGLAAKGLSPAQIDTVLQDCIRERDVEIRRIGFRDSAIGGGLTLLAVVIFAAGMCIDRYFYYTPVLALFGLWRLFKGLGRLTRGAKTKGSITDMG